MGFELSKQILHLAFSFYTVINQLHGVIMLVHFLNQRFKTMAVLQYHRKIGKMRRSLLLIKKRQLRRGRSSWVQTGRSEEWWNKLIGQDAPDSEWHSNFRLSKEAFQELFQLVSPHITPDTSSPNYRVLSPEKTLAVTLLFKRHWVVKNDCKSIWYCRLHSIKSYKLGN